MDDNTQQEKPSYILIQFAEIGSAIMDIQLMNVTAGQVFAASRLLDMKAQAGFIREENERLQRESEQSIARPSQGIITAKR